MMIGFEETEQDTASGITAEKIIDYREMEEISEIGTHKFIFYYFTISNNFII